ncbi:MAG: hypothetical protein B7Z75_07110 [Acidocella sp. 20-57-95]|nr:MAG: hypothetical protein B7Z75_07110 [Acidocella sp. 20-57-95]OYV58209.1 MAG: hypothetical protein B7Z71_10835 [Acidocella sp. 21-58-7]HQT63556.1 FliH/SctL family protein [Acidocella sp.]HQU04769.1 FliH/SctL family protein [Acidocella sp.]
MSFIVVSPGSQRPFGNKQVIEPEILDTVRQTEEIDLRVQQELARCRAAAEAEGRSVGLAAGRQEGWQEGRREATAEMQSASAALRDAWSQLAAPLAQKERDLAALVTDLAFELARHIVGSEVKASAASLQTLVTDLILEAATECKPGQTILVRLHPTDHAVIVGTTDVATVNLLADGKITQGGAMVEILNPDGDASGQPSWDATLEARIDAIRTSLALNRDTHA